MHIGLSFTCSYVQKMSLVPALWSSLWCESGEEFVSVGLWYSTKGSCKVVKGVIHLCILCAYVLIPVIPAVMFPLPVDKKDKRDQTLFCVSCGVSSCCLEVLNVSLTSDSCQ